MNRARQLTLDLSHREALSRDDFLIAPANEQAVAWIDRWPDWPSQALAISGPPGSGKTHLAHVFMAKNDAHLIDANQLGQIDVRDLVENNPTLILDNGDDVASDHTATKQHEEALFHFLNLLKETGHHAVLLSNSPPARWNVNLADLKSRLNAITHVAINEPDESLLAAVMVKQFSDRQLRIDHGAIDYILPRMERSFQYIHHIVTAIDALTLSEHRNITIPLIRQVLDNLNQEEMDI